MPSPTTTKRDNEKKSNPAFHELSRENRLFPEREVGNRAGRKIGDSVIDEGSSRKKRGKWSNAGKSQRFYVESWRRKVEKKARGRGRGDPVLGSATSGQGETIVAEPGNSSDSFRKMWSRGNPCQGW